MPALIRPTVLLLIVCLPALAQGQEKELPRVLIIGDSVYQQPAAETAKELKEYAQVVQASWGEVNIRDTTTAIEHLDRLLGYYDRKGEKLAEADRPKWDVIHFNLGLGDLIHRAPNMKSFRVMPIHAGGVVATDPKQYEKNLQELVKRLKATGAKLIWASTTPIRHSSTDVFEMGSEIKYNTIAARVMAEEKVATNDMYTYVRDLINMDKPAGHGADPFNFDRRPIHAPMVAIFLKQLNLPSQPLTDKD
jgi:hypothetical protein